MPVLLAYGDSNTHGTVPLRQLGEMGRLPLDERWVSVMGRALGPAWEVIAEGQPGRTTVHDDPVEGAHRNGLRVLPAILDTHRPIDMMILMLGTNDLKPRFSVSAFDIAASVARLLAVVRASGVVADAIVVAPAPVREKGCLAGMFEGAEARGAGLAGRLGNVAREAGYGFVDAGAHVEVDPVDGVHLGRDAHRVLGGVMAAAVKERMG